MRVSASTHTARLGDEKIAINPKTLSDWLGKFRDKVMSGMPGSRMRDRLTKMPELDTLTTIT